MLGPLIALAFLQTKHAATKTNNLTYHLCTEAPFDFSAQIYAIGQDAEKRFGVRAVGYPFPDSIGGEIGPNRQDLIFRLSVRASRQWVLHEVKRYRLDKLVTVLPLPHPT